MENTVTLTQAAELVGVKKEALRARGRRGSLEILSAGQGAPARVDREELVRAYPEAAAKIREFQPEEFEEAAVNLQKTVAKQAETAQDTAQRALAVLTQRHKEEVGDLRTQISGLEERLLESSTNERRGARLLAAATLLLGASGMYGWTRGQAVEAAERGAQEAQGARQAVSAELEGVRHELAEVVEQRDKAAAAHAQRQGQHQSSVSWLEAKIERLEGELEAREQRQDQVADFIARRMNELEAMAAEVQR